MKHYPYAHLARLNTALGEMLLAASPSALVGAWFIGQRHFPLIPPEEIRAAPLLGEEAAPLPFLLRSAASELLAWLEGKQNVFHTPLAPLGTPFQQKVWAALLSIPYGEKRSYGEVARSIGLENAYRAVGAAIGKNPLSIFIPCHRVLAKNGKLAGYAGGLARKEALLKLESRAGLCPDCG